MKLHITTGQIVRPQKIVVYGPEGIGKSTFATYFPDAVFLDTEGGTHHLDVARLPQPGNWLEAHASIKALATQKHEFRTLVIDTVDWLEKLLAEHICRTSNRSGIEDFGYGKGYVALGEEFAKFLASLDGLLRRGIHVVMLAHTKIVKFDQPDAAGSYDRYELKLTRNVAPLVKEWCDMLLFANYFTRVAEDDSGRMRGVGGRERKLYTSHSAAWDAKNRHHFDDGLPFEFASIARAFSAGTPKREIPSDFDEPPRTANAQPKANPLIDALAAAFTGRETDIDTFLTARGEIRAGQTWRDAAPEYLRRVATGTARFLDTVNQFLAKAAEDAAGAQVAANNSEGGTR